MVYTPETLSTMTHENGNQILLAIMGEVYDVSKNPTYYGAPAQVLAQLVLAPRHCLFSSLLQPEPRLWSHARSAHQLLARIPHLILHQHQCISDLLGMYITSWHACVHGTRCAPMRPSMHLPTGVLPTVWQGCYHLSSAAKKSPSVGILSPLSCFRTVRPQIIPIR
jgi:hypothetical protein